MAGTLTIEGVDAVADLSRGASATIGGDLTVSAVFGGLSVSDPGTSLLVKGNAVVPQLGVNLPNGMAVVNGAVATINGTLSGGGRVFIDGGTLIVEGPDALSDLVFGVSDNLASVLDLGTVPASGTAASASGLARAIRSISSTPQGAPRDTRRR